MAEKQEIRNEDEGRGLSIKKTLIISLIILITGGIITLIIFLTEPTASREGATKETAMLVDVDSVRRGTFQPFILATGTVEPAQDIVLSPRVSGEIIRLAEGFTPGGFVKKDEILLQIDPSDYRNSLQLRKSELKQAMANLDIEMGRQQVAENDYQLLEENLSGENESLVLREPQLNSVRSQVEAARAAVKQAELELWRTTIRAPFDAHILSRNVNTGSQVNPGDNLGRLVGQDVYWIAVTVPLSRLRWLRFPENGQKGSAVRIRNRTAWEENQYRTGHLYKLIGALEDQTRMARVLVTVEDPMVNQQDDTTGIPPLMIGAFVEVRIMTSKISDVIRLSRDYIRQDETVWVMEDGKLSIRDVEIVFTDPEHAYISEGLEEGDRVVTTNLSTVVEGASLRMENSTAFTGEDTLPGTARKRQDEEQPITTWKISGMVPSPIWLKTGLPQTF